MYRAKTAKTRRRCHPLQDRKGKPYSSALRHFPSYHPKQRRHRLFLPALVRRLRFCALLGRLLVAVVLELLLANRLLSFFRGHDRGGLALRASASRLVA